MTEAVPMTQPRPVARVVPISFGSATLAGLSAYLLGLAGVPPAARLGALTATIAVSAWFVARPWSAVLSGRAALVPDRRANVRRSLGLAAAAELAFGAICAYAVYGATHAGAIGRPSAKPRSPSRWSSSSRSISA